MNGQNRFAVYRSSVQPKHSLIIRAVIIIGQISSTAYIYYVPQYPLHGFNTIYVWNTQRIAYVVYIRKDERER